VINVASVELEKRAQERADKARRLRQDPEPAEQQLSAADANAALDAALAEPMSALEQIASGA